MRNQKKILFYDTKFNKSWIDKYNRMIFDKNKCKFCEIDYERKIKNDVKKYKIYTYDIFNNSIENNESDNDYFCK